MTGAGRVGLIETPWRGVKRGTRPVPGPWATPAVVHAVLSLVGADGHGVYGLPAVAACGVPEPLVATLATAHRGTATAGLRGPDGAPVCEVWGVHGLALLEALARELAVPVVLTHSWRLAAHYAAQALAAWLRAQDHPVPPLPPPPDLSAPSLPPPPPR
jgi:hypothetical protein